MNLNWILQHKHEISKCFYIFLKDTPKNRRFTCIESGVKQGWLLNRSNTYLGDDVYLWYTHLIYYIPENAWEIVKKKTRFSPKMNCSLFVFFSLNIMNELQSMKSQRLFLLPHLKLSPSFDTQCHSHWTTMSYIWMKSSSSYNFLRVDFRGVNL